MFDKLVESTSTGAELKPRRRIFAASFVLVAVLFAAAVVTSIYAADFDLGNDNFDIAQLLSPIAETEPPREPEPQQQRQTNQAATSDRPSRQMNILRPEESPSEIPPISVERSQYRSRPSVPFEISSRPETDGRSAGYPEGLPTGDGNVGSSRPPSQGDNEPVATQPPPPVKAPERKLPPQSLGVITGKASHLPKPSYPPAAKAVGASGAVNVQVTIDEQGNVISAKAIGGHILLRAVSEDAARRAKFSPTTLSKVPVKVTGVIVYNFTR
jgi:protein TonB